MNKRLTSEDIRMISITASNQVFATAMIEVNIRYYSEHTDAKSPETFTVSAPDTTKFLRDAGQCEKDGDCNPFELACMRVAWVCTTHLRAASDMKHGHSHNPIHQDEYEAKLIDLAFVIHQRVTDLMRAHGTAFAPVVLDVFDSIQSDCKKVIQDIQAKAKHPKSVTLYTHKPKREKKS